MVVGGDRHGRRQAEDGRELCAGRRFTSDSTRQLTTGLTGRRVTRVSGPGDVAEQQRQRGAGHTEPALTERQLTKIPAGTTDGGNDGGVAAKAYLCGATGRALLPAASNDRPAHSGCRPVSRRSRR